MTDRSSGHTEDPPLKDETIGMPRWVKVSLIVAASLIAAVIVVSLIVGHQLGPGRHFGLPVGGTSDLSAQSSLSYAPGKTDGGATYR